MNNYRGSEHTFIEFGSIWKFNNSDIGIPRDIAKKQHFTLVTQKHQNNMTGWIRCANGTSSRRTIRLCTKKYVFSLRTSMIHGFNSRYGHYEVHHCLKEGRRYLNIGIFDKNIQGPWSINKNARRQLEIIIASLEYERETIVDIIQYASEAELSEQIVDSLKNSIKKLCGYDWFPPLLMEGLTKYENLDNYIFDKMDPDSYIDDSQRNWSAVETFIKLIDDYYDFNNSGGLWKINHLIDSILEEYGGGEYRPKGMMKILLKIMLPMLNRYCQEHTKV